MTQDHTELGKVLWNLIMHTVLQAEKHGVKALVNDMSAIRQIIAEICEPPDSWVLAPAEPSASMILEFNRIVGPSEWLAEKVWIGMVNKRPEYVPVGLYSGRERRRI